LQETFKYIYIYIFFCKDQKSNQLYLRRPTGFLSQNEIKILHEQVCERTEKQKLMYKSYEINILSDKHSYRLGMSTLVKEQFLN